ncbi:Lactate utilization protein B [Candidatus Calditenuaceae archaeon HR02]|nr:Lactate utilization protein B [Candidatus Calditenuaceae archaeon HR02]
MTSYSALEEVVRRRLRQGPVRGLYSAMRRGLEGRAKAIAEMGDYEAFRSEARRIKERSVARFSELVDTFTRNAEKRGAKVYFARDGEEAVKIIVRIARDAQARLVAKSKSLTSEEILLNDGLQAQGLNVIETDLGERIIQLAREKPSHLVFPAIHKTLEDVNLLFSEEARREISSDIREIMNYIRQRLREIFLTADIGFNGANVAIAEIGAVVLETNEGNGRMTSSLPRVQVVLVGIEKIVETVEEALILAGAHAVAATGQRLTTYVSIMAGRSPMAGDSSREMHIVLLDNGRSRMLSEDIFREALYCIRCGACMNVCAPYSVTGGHIFGHIYPGPIGIPWTANIHGLDEASFAHLCISCGLCKEVCPISINIPLMISRVKNLLASRYGYPKADKSMMRYETLGKLASQLAPVSNWFLKTRASRYLLEKLVGLDRTVPLPEFRRDTFVKRFNRVRVEVPTPRARVALFLDFFPNYCRPEIAESLVTALQLAGVKVELPPQLTSGYPLIAYGDWEGAKKYAARNVELLSSYVEQGYSIVSIEPTATYTLKNIYPYLLKDDGRAEALAKNTLEALQVLWGLVSEGLLTVRARFKKRYGIHVPCHQRPLSGVENVLALMREAGLEAVVIEDGMCCGMGGTFGLKRGPIGRELSKAMGARLFEFFNSGGVETIVTESSVCAIHLAEGANVEVFHPLDILCFEKPS